MARITRKIRIETFVRTLYAEMRKETGTCAMCQRQIFKAALTRTLKKLWMVCPSDGQEHLEGVEPRCTTVEEARYFRKTGEYKKDGRIEMPEILT